MKTFYVFRIEEGEETPAGSFEIEGTVIEARTFLKTNARFDAGRYLILGRTSKIITKSKRVTEETALDFETEIKRPRQPKPDGATEPKPKKGKGAK